MQISNQIQVAFYSSDSEISLPVHLSETPILIPSTAAKHDLVVLLLSLLEKPDLALNLFIVNQNNQRDPLNAAAEEFPFEKGSLQQNIEKALAFFSSEAALYSSESIYRIRYCKPAPPLSISTETSMPDWISCICRIRQNEALVGCYDSILRQFSNSTSTLSPKSKPSSFPIKSIALSTDSNTYAFGCMNGKIHFGVFNDVELCAADTIITAHKSTVSGLCFVNNSIVSSGWDGALSLWNPQTNSCSATLQAHSSAKISGICASTSGIISVALDHRIKEWSIDGLLEKCSIPQSHISNCLDFSMISNLLLTGDTDSSIRGWDFRLNNHTSQSQFTLKGHSKWINCVKISPWNANMVVSSASDCSVRMWDLRHCSVPLSKLKFDSKILAVEWMNEDESSVLCGGENNTLSILR